MMDVNYETDKNVLAEFMENETVCWGIVSRLGRSAADGQSYMIAELERNQEAGIKAGGEKCAIFAGEADADNPNPYLMGLMGRRVPFVVLGVDEESGWLVCSRKRAQNILKTTILQGLATGKVYEGEVVGFSRYGGYVEVAGVTGHIRNSDFADDHSDIREYLKIGDKVEVKCKEIRPEGYIFWEAMTKVHRTKPIEHDFEEDTVVLGTVVRIANFKESTGVFVNLKLGIDALCSMPRELEIEEGSRVAVKIESVNPGKNPTDAPRIRGRIVKVS